MPENPMTAGGSSGAGLPPGLAFPHFSPFGGLPMDQRSHHWEPHTAAAAAAAARFHAIHHGLSVSGGTPSLSDLSLLAGRPRSGTEGGVPGGILGGTPTPGVTGSAAEFHAAAAVAYSRLTSPYMDPLYAGLHTSPTASLRLSPIDSRGSGLGMPPDYMSVAAASGFCPRSLSDLHPASTLGSAELAFAFDNARFASPRASVNRQSRKRALSCSPYSDSFDINSMIRFSPNSLVSLVNGSRGSSASGSYGHLSAGTMSPALGMGPGLSAGFGGGMPPLQQLQAHLLRSGPLAGSLPGSPFLHHSGLYNSPFSTHQSLYMPSLQHSLNIKQEGESTPKASPGVGAVSSTMEVDEHRGSSRKIKVRREPATTTCRINGDDKGDGDGMKDEPGDFIETNCHWSGCSLEFCTQEELVAHINTDHIHANKKVFICRWKDCSRGEKPFKAQYMLVVHMRRHTGEKPHRCTFEGCPKAYSRLENLKTHIRSHTGEKPYACEFPGCIKAFSNASDRAKHQNRTHSNEKPYVCKAVGCDKRYTDPSSLRKHVKTVHGADFYASKKHKGNDHSNGNDRHKGHRQPHNGNAESPRSEDMGSKTTSISSPSIKSEDPSSPHNQSSPGGDSSGTEINGSEPMEEPISDNNVSTTNEMSDAGYNDGSSPMMMQPGTCWDLKEEEESVGGVAELPEMMVGLPVGGGHDVPDDFFSGGGNGFGDSRTRFRNRLMAKGGFGGPMPSFSDNHGPRRGLGIENLNRRITDLKMESTPSASPMPSPATQGKPYGSDLNARLPNSHMTTTLKSPQEQSTINRRDSGNSTLSSYYSSMRSDGGQNSRRSSSQSQVSNHVPQVNPTVRALTNASPFDPISPGSSRRSSSISSNNGADNCTITEPLSSLASSSNTLTSSLQAQAHLERLHRRALGMDENSTNPLTNSGGSGSNYLIQSQTAALRTDCSWMTIMHRSSTNASGEMRRMSDPCTSGRPHHAAPQMMSNYVTPTQLTQALQRHQQQQHNSTGNGLLNQNGGACPPTQNYPPAEGTASMNDDFIIPDEMANYLSEVQNGNGMMRCPYPSDPTRPSTCPPPNSNGYPTVNPTMQHQNLPPPPSYNQAVGVSSPVNNGHFIQQSQQRKAQQIPNIHNNNGVNYANYNGSNNAAALYNQSVNSPSYSQQQSNTMSPKAQTHPMAMGSPMSRTSPPVAAAAASPRNIPPVPNSPNKYPPATPPITHHQGLPQQINPQGHHHQQHTAYYQQQVYNQSQQYSHSTNYYSQNTTAAPGGFHHQFPSSVPSFNNNGENGTNNGNYPGQNIIPQLENVHPSTPAYQGYPNQPSNYGAPQVQNYPVQQPTQYEYQNSTTANGYGNVNYNPTLNHANGRVAWPQESSRIAGQNPHWNGHRYFPNPNATTISNGGPFPPTNMHQQQQHYPTSKRGNGAEIQCKSVTSQSQKQGSNNIIPSNGSVCNKNQTMPTGSQQQQSPLLNNNVSIAGNGNPSIVPGPSGMRPEAYQRTLEYVQQCQQQRWVKDSKSGNGEHSNPLSPDSTTDNNNSNMCKSPMKQPSPCPSNNMTTNIHMTSSDTSQFLDNHNQQIMAPQQAQV